MPIPSPQSDETQDDFIDRCMSEYTEEEDSEVRAGICYTQWRNRKKAMTERLTIKNLEIKALKDREFEGYGSVFGNVDLGGDVVMPGAFKRSLAEHKSQNLLPMMFWMHKPDEIPGKWTAMEEDSKGLYVKGVLADTQLGRDVHTLLGMKAVRGLSIGYVTRDMDYMDDGVRLLKDIDLYETSIVSIAMNPLADITHAKSRLSEKGEYVPEIAEFKRKCEQFFREEGLSRKSAMMFVSNMFKVKVEDSISNPDVISEHNKQNNSSVTPDELELNAGISDFQEKSMLYELERMKNRYFS